MGMMGTEATPPPARQYPNYNTTSTHKKRVQLRQPLDTPPLPPYLLHATIRRRRCALAHPPGKLLGVQLPRQAQAIVRDVPKIKFPVVVLFQLQLALVPEAKLHVLICVGL